MCGKASSIWSNEVIKKCTTIQKEREFGEFLTRKKFPNSRVDLRFKIWDIYFWRYGTLKYWLERHRIRYSLKVSLSEFLFSSSNLLLKDQVRNHAPWPFSLKIGLMSVFMILCRHLLSWQDPWVFLKLLIWLTTSRS